jgi:hypothetical protein
MKRTVHTSILERVEEWVFHVYRTGMLVSSLEAGIGPTVGPTVLLTRGPLVSKYCKYGTRRELCDGGTAQYVQKYLSRVLVLA